MVCLYPVKISVKSDKKHSRFCYRGRLNYVSYGIKVPCGHCVPCLDNKVRVWSYRLFAESKKYDKMCFLTLTYEDGKLPIERGTTCTDDVQKFFKKLRRYYDYHKGSCNLSYFGALEYGGEKGRIHAHLLVFGLDYNDLIPKDKKVMSHNTISCTSRFWKNGIVNYGCDVSMADNRLVRYTTKYIMKIDTDNLYKYCRIMKLEKPKTFKSVGLGSDYLSKNIAMYGDLPTLNGLKITLPPYWKKKLDYSKDNIDWRLDLTNKEKSFITRKKLMSGNEDTNENYNLLLERMKRGIQ